jgi:hypothetical protein
MATAVELVLEAPAANEAEVTLSGMVAEVHKLSHEQRQSLLEAVVAQEALWPEEDDPAQSNDEYDAELKALLLQTRQLSGRHKQLLIEVFTGQHFQPPDSWFRSRVVRTGLPMIDRRREWDWLTHHEDEYIGQWVALCGDQLIAHGTNAKEVFEKADGCNALFEYIHPSRRNKYPYVAL